MTLVEIMIVVVIMAMIATAVGVAVVPQVVWAREETTRNDAATIRAAAERFVLNSAHGACPSVGDLMGEYIRTSSRMTDAWGNDFEIRCDEAEIAVRSAGPDGQMGTDDDIE